MEQKDYILRELEKIGAVIRYILQEFLGYKGKITLEKQIENAKEMLLTEINFDLDKFLDLTVENSKEYLCNFNGFNVENMELLAEYIFQIGFNDGCSNPKKHLEKALQLYELCNLKSKTYSLERETKIKAIKNILL